jgi:hypothetical protein
MHIDKKYFHPVLFITILSFPLLIYAAAPAASASSQTLFIIERSKNANEVRYEACLTESGGLDVRKPVRAFWINWEKDSTGMNREELNLIEKRMAFGFSVDRSRSVQSCSMKLVCCPKRPIRVFVSGGTVRAETAINARTAYLRKISVVTCEKQKILPKVLSVTVYGTDVASGEEVAETIRPR